jgi:predicted nuclease of predicted toxin-antitoxin system
VKLLLDQNLSRRLLPHLQSHFPGTTQVALVGLETASDEVIRNWAGSHGFAIVTKDADFVEMAILHGVPPKVIRLALGNVSNDAVCACLVAHVDLIRAFLAGSDPVLELDAVA